MTPKQKAEQLFELYLPFVESLGNIEEIKDRCKKCALIAVEEIKEAIFWHPFESPNFELEYWQEVKQKIEAL